MTSDSAASHKKSSLNLVTWVVLLSASLVLGGYGVLSFYSQKHEIERQIIGQSNESAERLARTLSPFLETYQINEYDKLTHHEIQTQNHSSLSAIVITDYKMGEILGREEYQSGWIRRSGQVRSFEPDDEAHRLWLQQAFYQKQLPITGPTGEVIGQVNVFANDRTLWQRSQVLMLQITATTLVLLAVLSLVLILLLRHTFIRPLKELASVVGQPGQEGMPEKLGPVSPYREISVLTDAIEQMLKTIAETQQQLQREHQNLENIVEGTRAGTWSWDIETGKTVFNERWAEILGYRLDELRPLTIDTWFSMVHPDDLEKSDQQLKQHFSKERDYYECEVRMRHKDGHWIWVLDRGRVASWSADGRPLEMFGTHLEISEIKHQTEQLELAASVYRQAHEGIMVVSDRGRIIDVNEAFTRITGYRYEEAVGQPSSLLSSGEQSREFYRELWRSLQQKGYWSGEIWNRRKNGEIYPELLSVSKVATDQQNTHYVALFSDITEIKAYEEQLKQSAHYDVLTGLPNRVLLFDRLREALDHCARGAHSAVAVFFLDLDGFKEVNDLHGHDAGDFLLIELARRLSAVVRGEDTLARLGGDEFVVVLPGIQKQYQLLPILERMLRETNEPVEMADGTILKVSASIGISLSDQGRISATQLVTQADHAMYQAKLKGKNSYCFADELPASEQASS